MASSPAPRAPRRATRRGTIRRAVGSRTRQPASRPGVPAGLLVLGSVLAVAGLLLLTWWLPWIFVRDTFADAAEKHKAASDLRGTFTQAFTAVGAVGTFVYTIRSFRTAQTSHLTERFESAAGQIGNDNDAVCIAGLYAMAQLADTWADSRQACIEVLCAHYRRSGNRAAAGTVLAIIVQHLRPGSGVGWGACRFDLSRTDIDGADFSGIVLGRGRMDFTGSRFSGATTFDGAVLSGSALVFSAAEFTDGCNVSFDGAQFAGGDLDLSDCRIEAGEVHFVGTRFRDEVRLSFRGIQLMEHGSLRFSADVDAKVDLARSHFYPGGLPASFSGSTFHQDVSFAEADFRRDVDFSGVTARSVLDFREAQFWSVLVFRRARLDGAVLELAQCAPNGGEIDLRGLAGARPATSGGGAALPRGLLAYDE